MLDFVVMSNKKGCAKLRFSTSFFLNLNYGLTKLRLTFRYNRLPSVFEIIEEPSSFTEFGVL